ncbi:MAG: phosphoglycerate dehydrogenase [Verrucomicrobiota bacterium]
MSTDFQILAADKISAKGLGVFEADDSFTIVAREGLKEPELIEQIQGVHGLIVRSATKVTRAALEAADQLKVIGRAGVGVDNVDVEAATERGVIVMNTPGGNTISTAEHTFSLMMALARQIPPAHATMLDGLWARKKFNGTELLDKTLAIAGMGRIGSEVARRAIAFGMRVVVYDPFLALSRAKALQVDLVDTLDELLPQADFLTLHMPLTKDTEGIIDATSLAKCKPGLRLVNCARGALINEADLLAALESGQIAGAGLDVFSSEPLPEDHPLRRAPNVVLTPHLAASTEEAQENVGIEIAEQIMAYLKEGSVRNAVNVPNVDARTMAELQPYLLLGVKLGRIASQLAPSRIDKLEIFYNGKAASLNTVPITRAVLRGLLEAAGGASVNEVNAPKIARRLGIGYEERKTSEAADYKELITVKVTSGEEEHSVAATLFANRPRLVMLEGFAVEADPTGVLFIMENQDTPGIVGWLGTFLGERQINIAGMTLARSEPGSRALSVLNLDTCPDASVLEELRQHDKIHCVKVVQL